MTETLSKLGHKHKCDKYTTHLYTQIYENYFHPLKNYDIKLLEIGIYRGASLKMWNDYFCNGHIYGIDILENYFGEGKPISTEEYSNRIKTLGGVDAGNRKDLERMIDTFNFKLESLDIIIDDGSHCLHDHQVSLGFLFKYLKPGGIYVIEDLISQNVNHNTKQTRTGNGVIQRGTFYKFNKRRAKDLNKWVDADSYLFPHEHNTVDMIKKMISSKQKLNEYNVQSEYMTIKEKDYLKNNLETIEAYQKNNLINSDLDIWGEKINEDEINPFRWPDICFFKKRK